MSATTSTRRERAMAEMQKALSEGLLNASNERAFFEALGIGEPRTTSILVRSKKSKRGQVLRDKPGKLREQWWAPAGMVNLNHFLIRRGVSSKLRTKLFRCMQEGKELPDQLADALTSYTETLLSRS